MSYGEEQQKEIATITMNLAYTQMKGVHEDVPEK